MNIDKTRHDYLFYEMARYNFNNIYALAGDLEESDDLLAEFSEKSIDEMSEEEQGKLNRHLLIAFNINMYLIQTILNCAFCLESFINDYGVEKFGKRYFMQHLDKLDIKSKWLIIPKLVTNKSIEKGGAGYESLKTIVGLRNKLVHSKSKKIYKDNHPKEMQDRLSQVDNCYNGVKVILNEFRVIEPDYEPLLSYQEGASTFERLLSTFVSISKEENE